MWKRYVSERIRCLSFTIGALWVDTITTDATAHAGLAVRAHKAGASTMGRLNVRPVVHAALPSATFTKYLPR